MDFEGNLVALCVKEGRMEDRESRDERAELISRTFALIIAKCGDATTLAAECQGRHPTELLRENAEKLRDLISEAGTIVDCVLELLRGSEA